MVTNKREQPLGCILFSFFEFWNIEQLFPHLCLDIYGKNISLSNLYLISSPLDISSTSEDAILILNYINYDQESRSYKGMY